MEIDTASDRTQAKGAEGRIIHDPGTRMEGKGVVQGLFLDILKKTQTQKNSKLKPNPEKTRTKFPKKTQNLPTPLEFSCWDGNQSRKKELFFNKSP